LANPLVAGEFGLRFYVGIPLTTHDNHNLGVLSIIDFEPRTISEDELDTLKILAQIIMDEMELRLSARQVDELSKEKANLLAVLSHEIRTPMNGVMGMASILQSTGLTDEQKECTDIIETSGQSLLNLINHILDYSKIESGKMELILDKFNIRSCMEQVLKLFTSEIAKKQIILHSEIDSGIPAELIGDEQKIRQILINLLGNAFKFTKKGTIEVFVNMLSRETEHVHISFTIRDSGIGIDNDKIDRLFQTFSQVHGSVPGERFGGTGLGLSICKQLVELMNGRIWLEESLALQS
jgi:signal transduction histidine kinase